MASERKHSDLTEIVSEIKLLKGSSERVVFVSGNFNVIHPGHLRLLNFAAECGDFLAVGVTQDNVPGTLIPENLRLEGIKAISAVDYAFLLPGKPEELVNILKPEVVVKGKEHEVQFNPERPIIEAYGGKLLFGSGEVRFSSMDLLQRELRESNLSTIRMPSDFPIRHGFDIHKLVNLLSKFSSMRIVVIGDLILDEYVTCDPLGMSQEDPTIVVTPIKRDMFVGGAGIVAAHASALGAKVYFFSVVGNDQTANFAQQTLENYGVDTYLLKDDSRPSTLKQRYRAHGKTLLRVSHLRQHDISRELIAKFFEELDPTLDNADLVVFSDFNYGCLPQPLVNLISARCLQRGIPMVADSQSSSQVGDVSRFQDMLLLTPTEHEARLALRDQGSGLVVLADALCKKAKAQNIFITLGAEGLLIHANEENGKQLVTDQLPAFNTAPRDVSGAGDCLLICASLALAAGASIWESAYLGSIAAACQVGRVGNTPLSAAEVIQELML
ncbi:MAG: D-beta-D-heptose 7-phosphate kinase [Betaproteobacteria bacterium ADurb.Bin341]|nr:MAG: D-beta-D-heptose 7-phosphate kinase [Betaproteobacteria bacterium ADurb.Bin341]